VESFLRCPDNNFASTSNVTTENITVNTKKVQRTIGKIER
jgi:hypothetical protein